MKIQKLFEKEVKDIDKGTLKRYIIYLKRIPIKTEEELKTIPDDKLVEILNKQLKETHERSRMMARSAFIKLLLLLNKENLKLRLLKPRKIPRKILKKWLEFNTIKKIVDSCDDLTLKLIIMLQYDTCTRISAVLGISLEDIIDFKKVVVFEKKVARGRTVSLSKKTQELLKEYVEKNNIKKGKLFKNPYITIYKKQKKLFKDVLGDKGEQVSSHWFRASRAVHLFQHGFDIETIKRQGDWDSADSLLTYLRESGVELEKIMKKAEPEW